MNASEEAKRLLIDLGKAQAESNLLIMEIKKYDGIVQFMELEKDLITKAMEDARGVDPGLAARGLHNAEQRMTGMDDNIREL
jgi:hypothetical protein